MTRFGISIGAAVILLATAGAWAGETDRQEQVNQLRAAEKNFAGIELSTKGGPRQRASMERQRIDNLIDRLEAGEAVDPAEIDRAIKRAERGTF